MSGETIRLRGIVQGVGFRPTVARVARRLGLDGWVQNDADGVLVAIEGAPAERDAFLATLLAELPPLAKVISVDRRDAPDLVIRAGFAIVESAAGHPRTAVSPDAATCAACLAEVLDPAARRSRYPFTTCTHCGPRFTIVTGIPYDRQRTTMASFPMCPDCRAEYEDSTDRRFHAEPIACPACGPKVAVSRADQQAFTWRDVSPVDEIDAVATLLEGGEIVAIKGLGGYHLCCDATNEDAVRTLREKKRRPSKPFALMAADLAMIDRYCDVSAAEREALLGPVAPIVLLTRRADVGCPSGATGDKAHQKEQQQATPFEHGTSSTPREGAGRCPPPASLRSAAPPKSLSPFHSVREGRGASRPSKEGCLAVAASVAPEQRTLGFMLPSTPLHHLLMRRMTAPIVCTSGNLTEEPPCTDAADAREHLAGIASFYLDHDRPIAQRIDDSVVKMADGEVRVIRRARGYSPAPLALPPGFDGAPRVLATGAQWKGTLCLLQDGVAVLSQHLGDLDDLRTFAEWERTRTVLMELYEHTPEIVSVDMHPDYRSTRAGLSFAEDRSLPVESVAHHHAHVAACLAEHGVPRQSPPVLGVALDGLGLGDDGTLWGGEFLIAGYASFTRAGTMKPVPLLGGDLASMEPWRNLYAHLRSFLEWDELLRDFGDLPVIRCLADKPRALLDQALRSPSLAPPASSCGRLFDAVAAAIGLHTERVDHEGQAAIALEQALSEQALSEAAAEGGYPFTTPHIDNGLPCIEPREMWRALLRDLQAGTDRARMAARFHAGLAGAIVRMVGDIAARNGLWAVALVGGVWQNRALLELVAPRLRASGLRVLVPRAIPVNDGGIALGQAVIAAARALER
ncbi:MAG: carbamoyltransferase HypF [Polyangiaceae bacterium]